MFMLIKLKQGIISQKRAYSSCIVNIKNGEKKIREDVGKIAVTAKEKRFHFVLSS